MMFPSGEWSLTLIGDQWPDDEDLAALSHGKLNRGNIKTGFTHFADMLRNAQSGPLANQQGYTADDLRNAFRQGEEQARQVAEKNGTKEGAYESAYNSMVSLQQDLTHLANEYNQQIDDIKKSKEPTEAKVTQIVAAINQGRTLASMAAAKWSGNVFDAMQRVLDAEGPGGQSARQFAQAHGLDAGNMFRHPEDQQTLEQGAKKFIENDGSPMGFANGAKLPLNQNPTPPDSPISLTHSARLPPGTLPPTSSPSSTPSPMNLAKNAKIPGPQAPPPAPAQPAAPMASAPSLSHGGGGGGSMPGAPSLGSPSSAMSGPPTSGMPGGQFAGGGPPQTATPGELMHSFDKGLQAGTPLSGTGAVPPAQTEPQLPPSAPTTPMAGTGVPVTAQAYESPAPISHASAPEAAPAPQMMAGPAASSGPASVAPPTSGQLPAYASDIRPAVPAATAPAASPSLPPSMTPGSAPVHPSAGQGGPGTPTVVRQATPPPPPASPSGLGTESVAATATGALAGAASANATARGRLQRLVSSVARQQPRLAWAAGDRPDNTTVLATDLASGWIPPGIELPAAITLLPPERRRGDLETLLGEVSVAAGYTPIHHIPEEDEPIPTSPRPRHVAEIDELGWELSQATQWRDGLPRLAHTLAKAASGGTGVLDKEVELLQQHLATVSSRVLDSYPENVDPHDVGNWQLLAAIDALVTGDKSTATYHLAWFQACSTTAEQAHQ
ncbi:putative transmembrane protein [Mycobacterium numidiamassiliense]|uniref:Putative transmembrane protein n=1 Tax=Mycobacterium numidiamassiliense TaxID=1841861 RepID=A0A2U3PEV4_9MYCO|nr:putative transmembrane protein [Mycobacterium numidiamassiliense]